MDYSARDSLLDKAGRFAGTSDRSVTERVALKKLRMLGGRSG
jgi:hypothetical protein